MPTGTEGDYEVGYGKPPRGAGFKKGQSGDPRGRPPGAKNLTTLLNEPVTVTENGRRHKVTKREAVIEQLVNKSASVKARSLKILLDLMLNLEPRARSSAAPLPSARPTRRSWRSSRRGSRVPSGSDRKRETMSIAYLHPEAPPAHIPVVVPWAFSLRSNHLALPGLPAARKFRGPSPTASPPVRPGIRGEIGVRAPPSAFRVRPPHAWLFPGAGTGLKAHGTTRGHSPAADPTQIFRHARRPGAGLGCGGNDRSPGDRRCLRPALAGDDVLDRAYAWLCRRRRGYPPHADIWSLHLSRPQEKLRPRRALLSGEFPLGLLERVTMADGSEADLWSARDALVLKALTLVLAPVLPASPHCTHLKRHGGAKGAGRRVLAALPKNRFTLRTDVKSYYPRSTICC